MPEGSVRDQMERTISVWSEQKFWVHFDRSYQSDRNVPDKIVLPGTAPLYPAYKNNMADISESSIFKTNSRLICLVAVSMLNKNRWMTL